MTGEGVPTEFGEFVTAHQTTLYRTAYLLTGTSALAEELVQDTLVRLYPRWHLVTRADAPVAYVRRSLVNAFTSERRRTPYRSESLAVVPDRPAPTDDYTAVADSSQLWSLLVTLPERQRAALVLRYFLDLTDAEIAESIGCHA